VLFVSHNMAAVESLCNRCLSLFNGRLLLDGSPVNVISEYLAKNFRYSESSPLADRIDRIGSGEVRFTNARFLNSKDDEVAQVIMGGALTIEAEYAARQSINEPVFGFLFVDALGRIVMRAYSFESYNGPPPVVAEHGKVRCYFEQLPLMAGMYHLHFWVSQHRYPIDFIEYAAQLEILQADVYGTGHAPDAYNGGTCYAPHRWEFTS